MVNGQRVILKPMQTELVLDIVNHHTLTLAAVLFRSILGRRVGTLELEVIATLDVLAAIGLPKDGVCLVLGDFEGIREKLVTGNGILIDYISASILGFPTVASTGGAQLRVAEGASSQQLN